jgi:hypothetical protein
MTKDQGSTLGRLAVAWLAVLGAFGCGDDSASFTYEEVTAEGRSIRYLLDANASGQTVGSVPDPTTELLSGFVMDADGSASFWTVPGHLAYPTAINASGTVVGTNIPAEGGLPEGFVRDSAGTETEYAFPDALGTVPFGISDDGTYTGFYITEMGRRGFVDQPSTGLSRSVHFPGAAETQLYAVNNNGQAGGAYYDADGTAYPFIYDIATDTFDEIAPPADGNFVVSSINDRGDAIVFGLRSVDEGYADLRSFYRDGDSGAVTELHFPDAEETYGYDVDHDGVVIGYYLSASGEHGGFRAEPAP